MELSTQQKGEIAHLKVQLAAIEKGFILSKPIIESRYDFILDDGKERKRVQVKYAGQVDDRWGGEAAMVDFRKVHKNTMLRYSESEVDLILAYIPHVDKIIKIGPENFNGRSGFQVRTKRPTNNHKYNWYEDFLW